MTYTTFRMMYTRGFLMLNKVIRFYAVTAAFVFGAAAVALSASMAALISVSVGGAPIGAEKYENSDNLAATGGLGLFAGIVARHRQSV